MIILCASKIKCAAFSVFDQRIVRCAACYLTEMANLTIETLDGDKTDFVYTQGLAFLSSWLTPNTFPDVGQYTKHLNDIRALDIRDDDLFLATYPKCGTNWVWEIMTMLRKGNTTYEKVTKEALFLDFTKLPNVDDFSTPRILNSHLFPNQIPKGIIDKKKKIVHVMRNPKDALVSLYYFCRIGEENTPMFRDFKTFLQYAIGTYGVSIWCSFFDYIKHWEVFTKQHPEQILNIFYEDLKEDPVREIKKIDKFLETNRDEELITQIAEACSFQNLKKADLDKTKEDLHAHGAVYRKGMVGDWKTHFTVSMNEEIDKWIEENSRGSDIKFRYTL
ncbi:sulfotransferase [Mactra antiquata]